MAKRVKTNYDRGYVNAMDKICVFIESSSKVMYVDGSREISRSIGCSCTYIIALIFRPAKWTSAEQKMV